MYYVYNNYYYDNLLSYHSLIIRKLFEHIAQFTLCETINFIKQKTTLHSTYSIICMYHRFSSNINKILFRGLPLKSKYLYDIRYILRKYILYNMYFCHHPYKQSLLINDTIIVHCFIFFHEM